MSVVENGSGSEIPRVKPVMRASQTDSLVTLPAVDPKQCTTLRVTRSTEVSSDERALRCPDAAASPSAVEQPTLSQVNLPASVCETLFLLESEDDDDTAGTELFPMLKRQLPTETAILYSASTSLPHVPHQPPSSTKELTRALLNTRFHARRLHTPVWDGVTIDRDCPIGHIASVSSVSPSFPMSLSTSHSAASDDDHPLRYSSNQASADFADYMQQHLSELKERQSAPLYFGHVKHTTSSSITSSRSGTLIQWSAFEFREDEPPSLDNPFTRWFSVAAVPCNPALSNSRYSGARRNFLSETDGPSDNPLTGGEAVDTVLCTPPILPPVGQPACRSYATLAVTSILVSAPPKSYDDAQPTSAPTDVLAGEFLIAAKKRHGEVDPDAAMLSASPTVPSRADAHMFIVTDTTTSTTGGAAASGVSPVQGLSATEEQLIRPVSPSGRRSVAQYSQTFVPHAKVKPEVRGVGSVSSFRQFSTPTSRESMATTSAPTVPLACPPAISRRPILSVELPHKSQLARRALEDNELFFQNRRNESAAPEEGSAKKATAPRWQRRA